MQNKEQRQFIRLAAYHLAKYKPLSGQTRATAPSLANIKDIGAGGACLVAGESLPAGSLIELKISFPSLSASISTLAKITRARQIGKSRLYRIGVQFVEIDNLLRKAIDEQVRFVYRKAGIKE